MKCFTEAVCQITDSRTHVAFLSECRAIWQSGLRVISVYGYKDGVLDVQKYTDNLKNLPEVSGIEHRKITVDKTGLG